MMLARDVMLGGGRQRVDSGGDRRGGHHHRGAACGGDLDHTGSAERLGRTLAYTP
jgi:hypothetical protein